MMARYPISRRLLLRGGAGTAAMLLAGPRVSAQQPDDAGGTPPADPEPAPDLLRMLAFVPNGDDAAGGLLSFRVLWQGILSFANLSAAKRLYGFDNVRSPEDVLNNGQAYGYATNGCYVTDFTGSGRYAGGPWREAFGYDVLQVDREISAGQPPGYFSRMEGPFDADAIIAKLTSGGYSTASHAGIPYLTIRGDNQIQVDDARSNLAFGRMNRVAVDAARVTAVGATATMEALLDAEAQPQRTLADSPTFRALAVALGDVTSMLVLPGATTVGPGSLTTDQLADLIKDWGTLHVPELTAMGYTDSGGYQRTMHVALVYANPDDAAADAPELVNRLAGYRSVLTRQPLIPTYATAVASRTITEGGKGVLIADVALVEVPQRGGLW
ncbi:MAG: hypothetical protein ACR2JW_19040, partial [Thermomicrobiales bacterium]